MSKGDYIKLLESVLTKDQIWEYEETHNLNKNLKFCDKLINKPLLAVCNGDGVTGFIPMVHPYTVSDEDDLVQRLDLWVTDVFSDERDVLNGITNCGYQNLGNLVATPNFHLRRSRNFGKQKIATVESKLDEHNLSRHMVLPKKLRHKYDLVREF